MYRGSNYSQKKCPINLRYSKYVNGLNILAVHNPVGISLFTWQKSKQKHQRHKQKEQLLKKGCIQQTNVHHVAPCASL